MVIRDKRLKFYIDGKEVGEGESVLTCEDEMTEDRWQEFKHRCTLSYKSDNEVKMFISRPERIRKYVKQIIKKLK